MKIPTLSEEDKQRMFTRIWVRHIYEATSFIMEKLGPQAIEEYNEQRTKQSVEQFSAIGKDPMSFAMVQAITCKNVFGSNVEVVQDKNGGVILNIKECNRLKTVLELAAKGVPVTKRQYCGICINGYYKKVAEKLELHLGVKFTDEGCKMTIRK
jgi:hypothetical protein